MINKVLIDILQTKVAVFPFAVLKMMIGISNFYYYENNLKNNHVNADSANESPFAARCST